MTLAADMTPAERERDALILALRNKTALSRLNHTEAHEIFSAIAALGYTIAKTPAPAAVKA